MILWDELIERNGMPDMSVLGHLDGFSIHHTGERESPEAVELRHALTPVVENGRLTGLKPPHSIGEPRSILDDICTMREFGRQESRDSPGSDPGSTP